MRNLRWGEMLAILGVVAVLAAILFPVFAQTKGGPKRVGCLSSLKQIGLGGIQYASDHDDRFPLRDSWVDVTERYVRNGSFFHCDRAPKGAYGYAFDAALSGMKIPDEPSSVPLEYDSVNPIRNASDLITSLPSPGRHTGIDYMAYADGHARGVRVGATR